MGRYHSYTQNFNSLANSGTSNTTLPSGWAFVESGSAANSTYVANDGTFTVGNTYSYGTGTNSDRAFGELTSNTVQSIIGAAFVNSTRFVNNARPDIESFSISYTGEQWHLGVADSILDRLDFQYSTNATSLANGTWIDVNALDFSSPRNSGTVGALDGNASGNRRQLGPITFNPPGGVPNGGTFFIRWVPLNITDADDGLSIDDFSLSYVLAPNENAEPNVYGNFGAWGTNIASAWNKESAAWTSTTVGTSSIEELVGIGSNFIAVNGATAAAWNHRTSIWTITTLSAAIQIAAGHSPEPRTWISTNPTTLWSAGGNWDSVTTPAVDWIIELENQTAPVQELIVDEDAAVFSVDVRGDGGTMRLNVADGVTLTVLENVRLRTGGELTLSGGILNAGSLNLIGGSISGTGHFAGNITNDGIVSPGFSPGILNVDGNYTQTPTGTLAIEIGGLTSGSDYDKLVVVGIASLAGTLSLSFIDGFAPGSGNVFDILDWGSLSETTFNTLSLPTLNGSLVWDTSQLYTTGTLSVVLPGDFNFDGFVDAADYVVWRKNGGTQEEFDTWRANFGHTAASGSGFSNGTSVPEPTTLLMILTAASLPFFRRRSFVS